MAPYARVIGSGSMVGSRDFREVCIRAHLDPGYVCHKITADFDGAVGALKNARSTTERHTYRQP